MALILQVDGRDADVLYTGDLDEPTSLSMVLATMYAYVGDNHKPEECNFSANFLPSGRDGNIHVLGVSLQEKCTNREVASCLLDAYPTYGAWQHCRDPAILVHRTMEQHLAWQLKFKPKQLTNLCNFPCSKQWKTSMGAESK